MMSHDPAPSTPSTRQNPAAEGAATTAATTATVDVPDVPSVDSRFSCNICFEPCQEPVVTQCGHLYCWPCLFRWIEPAMTPDDRSRLSLPTPFFTSSHAANASRRGCPVCKSPISVSSLVPIYVRSNDTTETNIPNNNNNNNDIEPSPPKRQRQETDNDNAQNSTRQQVNDDGNEQPVETNTAVSTPNNASSTPTNERRSEQSSMSIPVDTNEQEEGEGGGGSSEMEDPSASLTESTGLRQRLRFRSRDSEISADDRYYQQREQQQQQDDHQQLHQQQHQPVPNRPAANTPQRHTNDMGGTGGLSPYANNPYRPSNSNSNSNSNPNVGAAAAANTHRWMVTPMSPNGHGASLTHGIMLSFAQATAAAGGDGNTNNNNNVNSNNDNGIPSLHYPQQNLGINGGGNDRNNTTGNNLNHNNGDGMSNFAAGGYPIDVTSETTQYLSRLLIMLTSFVVLCLLLL